MAVEIVLDRGDDRRNLRLGGDQIGVRRVDHRADRLVDFGKALRVALCGFLVVLLVLGEGRRGQRGAAEHHAARQGGGERHVGHGALAPGGAGMSGITEHQSSLLRENGGAARTSKISRGLLPRCAGICKCQARRRGLNSD